MNCNPPSWMGIGKRQVKALIILSIPTILLLCSRVRVVLLRALPYTTFSWMIFLSEWVQHILTLSAGRAFGASSPSYPWNSTDSNESQCVGLRSQPRAALDRQWICRSPSGLANKSHLRTYSTAGKSHIILRKRIAAIHLIPCAPTKRRPSTPDIIPW